jgi:hypothetical protein
MVVAVSNDGDRPVNITAVQVRGRRRLRRLRRRLVRPPPPPPVRARRPRSPPQAWLENPVDASQRAWNFTRQAVGEVLEGSRETAIEYRMWMPRMLEASQDVRLVTVVTYVDPASRVSRLSAATAFNATLTFTGNPLPFDAKVYLPYALAAVVVFGALLLLKELASGKGRKAASAIGAGTVAELGDDEPDLSIMPDAGARRRKVPLIRAD